MSSQGGRSLEVLVCPPVVASGAACHLPDACDLDMPSGQADAPFSSDLCPEVPPSVLRAP